MNPAIAARLAELNRRFYAEHAADFARRRATPQPGSLRLLERISSGTRVLEIGCGDGKVAHTLLAHTNVAAYLGLDLDPDLLARARNNLAANLNSPSGMERFSFVQADLTSPNWARALPPEAWDWILAFSVFHHLPGFEARAQLLRTLTDRLAAGGACAMSNWQFTRSARLMRRSVPWSELHLTPAEVEVNDFLLAWERSGRRGLRYVHLLDADEARRLAHAAGLKVTEVFQSDGVTGDLADYVLLRKAE